MNFAVPFTRNFKYLDEDVQLNIRFKPLIKELNDFIDAYGSHRINLIIQEFNSDNDLKIIKALQEKYPNTKLVVCLPFYAKDLDEIMSKSGIPYYYNEFVTNWDKFNGFLSLDVTDIFIAEELAFSAKILSSQAKKFGKSLRVFCNVCQSSWDDTPSLKTFFIRPEDLQYYEGLIDTVEFYINEEDSTKINTLYEVYSKTKMWYGKLSELIVGYKTNEDSRFIIPRFGIQRVNCEKKCARGLDPTCHLCDRVAELEETLKAEKIAVVVDKNKNL